VALENTIHERSIRLSALERTIEERSMRLSALERSMEERTYRVATLEANSRGTFWYRAASRVRRLIRGR
jgi:hypothetical protein